MTSPFAPHDENQFSAIPTGLKSSRDAMANASRRTDRPRLSDRALQILHRDLFREDEDIWRANRFRSIAAWSAADFNADAHVDVSDFNQ